MHTMNNKVNSLLSNGVPIRNLPNWETWYFLPQPLRFLGRKTDHNLLNCTTTTIDCSNPTSNPPPPKRNSSPTSRNSFQDSVAPLSRSAKRRPPPPRTTTEMTSSPPGGGGPCGRPWWRQPGRHVGSTWWVGAGDGKFQGNWEWRSGPWWPGRRRRGPGPPFRRWRKYRARSGTSFGAPGFRRPISPMPAFSLLCTQHSHFSSCLYQCRRTRNHFLYFSYLGGFPGPGYGFG